MCLWRCWIEVSCRISIQFLYTEFMARTLYIEVVHNSFALNNLFLRSFVFECIFA